MKPGAQNPPAGQHRPQVRGVRSPRSQIDAPLHTHAPPPWHRGLAVTCVSLATRCGSSHSAYYAARQTDIAMDLLQLGGGLIQRYWRG
eukprot:4781717-Prymnesium_polylepis.2